MDIGVIGINFKTAPLAIREAFAAAAKSWFETAPHWFKGVLLSTCNRTEIYFSQTDSHSEILMGLRRKLSFFLEPALYSYFGQDCFRHLVSVAAGLESAILAESDIQRQVRGAYENAATQFVLPSHLHYLFQKSLKISKQLRTLPLLSKPQVALEQMVFRLRQAFFSEKEGLPILFVGNSQINRKIIAYFLRKGSDKLTLCTRHGEDARGLNVESREHLSEWPSYRLMICGSSEAHHLITLEEMKKKPPAHRLLILDLALPRNVSPAVQDHPMVELLNIDDMGALMSRYSLSQRQQLYSYLELIEQEVSKQLFLYEKRRSRVIDALS